MILPDFLAPGLKVVICGTAVGWASSQTGHYYAGTGNDFWSLLYESGLTTERLSPAEDVRITEFGLGLTDLAKTVVASSDVGLRDQYDICGFIRKIRSVSPQWVAFHGKEAAKAVGRAHTSRGRVCLGTQDWSVAGRPVFVLPSASGANRDSSRLEGKASRLDWYQELKVLIERP